MGTQEIRKEKDIKGWLAFFVYVWVGLGSLFSLFLTLIILIGGRADIDLYIFLLLYEAIPFTIGIATVRAFILEKSNAVSLARTFIVICSLKAFFVLFLFTIANDNYLFYIQFFVSCLQCVAWLVYLNRSKQVQYVIPIETRTWKLFEKLLLSVYALLVVLFMLIVLVYVTMNEQIMANKNNVEQVLKENYAEGIADTVIMDIHQFSYAFVCAEIGADSLEMNKKEFAQFVKEYAMEFPTIRKSVETRDEVLCELLDANDEVVYRVWLKKDTTGLKEKFTNKH